VSRFIYLISLLVISFPSVIAAGENRFGQWEEIHVDYALNKDENKYGKSKYLVVVSGIPDYIDRIQIANGTASASRIIGKSNKDVQSSGSGSYVEFKIDLAEPDEDIFRIKAFRKTEFGYRIVDRFTLTINVIKCPALDEPVCADSGRYDFPAPRTYKNLCEYERAKAKNPKVTLINEGSCNKL